MDKAILMGIQEYIRNDYLTPVIPTDVLAGVVAACLGSAFVWYMWKKIGQVINIG